MNIVICEDELFFQTDLKEKIAGSLLNANGAVKSVKCYSSAEDFLYDWESGEARCDLLFMDIYLSGETGYAAAERIRQSDDEMIIVFVTSSEDFLIKGYRVGAYRYLLKPVKQEEVDECLAYARKRAGEEKKALWVNKDGIMVRIEQDAVVYVESIGHKICMHMEDGSVCEYVHGGSLSDVEAALKSSGFMRCHKSFIINPRYVTGYRSDLVMLKDQPLFIAIGRKYRKEVLEVLNGYMLSQMPL